MVTFIDKITELRILMVKNLESDYIKQCPICGKWVCLLGICCHFKPLISPEIISKNIRPWVRFWARFLDILLHIQIFNILLGIILLITNIIGTQALLFGETYAHLIFIFLLISYILLEAYLLSTLGYTLGKWLLKVKIRDINGKKLSYITALKRIIFLIIYGLAIFIPFIGFPVLADSYHHIAYHNITMWDIHSNIVVTYSTIGVFRTTLAIVLLFLNLLFFLILEFM